MTRDIERAVRDLQISEQKHSHRIEALESKMRMKLSSILRTPKSAWIVPFVGMSLLVTVLVAVSTKKFAHLKNNIKALSELCTWVV